MFEKIKEWMMLRRSQKRFNLSYQNMNRVFIKTSFGHIVDAKTTILNFRDIETRYIIDKMERQYTVRFSEWLIISDGHSAFKERLYIINAIHNTLDLILSDIMELRKDNPELTTDEKSKNIVRISVLTDLHKECDNILKAISYE